MSTEPCPITPPEPDTVIEARGLTKRYAADTVVDGIDIAVPRGQCWGLLGPNGAGKTTFIRMVLGKTPPSGGSLTVLGRPVPPESARVRARIGVVPQQDNLDPDFSVVENLRAYGAYFGIDAATLEERIPELVALASLETRAEAPIATLSGGMQRRLALSRALVNAPELLILDEPTTGLDPQARRLIWDRLRTLRARGMSLVLTTHYMEEAERLCDRVTVMDRGRILDSDAPASLVRRHAESHVIEVRGEALDGWEQEAGRLDGVRLERAAGTLYHYVDDASPLLARLEERGDLAYLHRPANLEDVFLRLTGRDLRDG